VRAERHALCAWRRRGVASSLMPKRSTVSAELVRVVAEASRFPSREPNAPSPANRSPPFSALAHRLDVLTAAPRQPVVASLGRLRTCDRTNERAMSARGMAGICRIPAEDWSRRNGKARSVGSTCRHAVMPNCRIAQARGGDISENPGLRRFQPSARGGLASGRDRAAHAGSSSSRNA
jgi:hypothetical protein